MGYLNREVKGNIKFLLFIAEDGFGGEATSDFTLSVKNLSPLVKKSVENQTGLFIGKDFNFLIPDDIFFDPDNDTLRYKVEGADGSSLPSWLKYQKSSESPFFISEISRRY